MKPKVAQKNWFVFFAKQGTVLISLNSTEKTGFETGALTWPDQQPKTRATITDVYLSYLPSTVSAIQPTCGCTFYLFEKFLDGTLAENYCLILNHSSLVWDQKKWPTSNLRNSSAGATADTSSTIPVKSPVLYCTVHVQSTSCIFG